MRWGLSFKSVACLCALHGLCGCYDSGGRDGKSDAPGTGGIEAGSGGRDARDAGASDAGPDAGHSDAGRDAGVDAGHDGGTALATIIEPRTGSTFYVGDTLRFVYDCRFPDMVSGSSTADTDGLRPLPDGAAGEYMLDSEGDFELSLRCDAGLFGDLATRTVRVRKRPAIVYETPSHPQFGALSAVEVDALDAPKLLTPEPTGTGEATQSVLYVGQDSMLLSALALEPQGGATPVDVYAHVLGDDTRLQLMHADRIVSTFGLGPGGKLALVLEREGEVDALDADGQLAPMVSGQVRVLSFGTGGVTATTVQAAPGDAELDIPWFTQDGEGLMIRDTERELHYASIDDGFVLHRLQAPQAGGEQATTGSYSDPAPAPSNLLPVRFGSDIYFYRRDDIAAPPVRVDTDLSIRHPVVAIGEYLAFTATATGPRKLYLADANGQVQEMGEWSSFLPCDDKLILRRPDSPEATGLLELGGAAPVGPVALGQLVDVRPEASCNYVYGFDAEDRAAIVTLDASQPEIVYSMAAIERNTPAAAVLSTDGQWLAVPGRSGATVLQRVGGALTVSANLPQGVAPVMMTGDSQHLLLTDHRQGLRSLQRLTLGAPDAALTEMAPGLVLQGYQNVAGTHFAFVQQDGPTDPEIGVRELEIATGMTRTLSTTPVPWGGVHAWVPVPDRRAVVWTGSQARAGRYGSWLADVDAASPVALIDERWSTAVRPPAVSTGGSYAAVDQQVVRLPAHGQPHSTGDNWAIGTGARFLDDDALLFNEPDGRRYGHAGIRQDSAAPLTSITNHVVLEGSVGPWLWMTGYDVADSKTTAGLYAMPLQPMAAPMRLSDVYLQPGHLSAAPGGDWAVLVSAGVPQVLRVAGDEPIIEDVRLDGTPVVGMGQQRTLLRMPRFGEQAVLLYRDYDAGEVWIDAYAIDADGHMAQQDSYVEDNTGVLQELAVLQGASADGQTFMYSTGQEALRLVHDGKGWTFAEPGLDTAALCDDGRYMAYSSDDGVFLVDMRDPDTPRYALDVPARDLRFDPACRYLLMTTRATPPGLWLMETDTDRAARAITEALRDVERPARWVGGGVTAD